MKRGKAKKKAATKKAAGRRKTKKTVKPKAKARAKKKAVRVKPINITARAPMAGVLCFKADGTMTVVKRLTKEVQDAVDAGTISAIALKGPRRVLTGGVTAPIPETRIEAFLGIEKKVPAVVPVTAKPVVAVPQHDDHEEETKPVPAPSFPTDADQPHAQAAQGDNIGG